MLISGAGHSVDTFPKDVGVTVVPGLLLAHVHSVRVQVLPSSAPT